MIARVSARLLGHPLRTGLLLTVLILAGAAVALAQVTQGRHDAVSAEVSLSTHVIPVGGIVHGEIIFHNPGRAPAVLERDCSANRAYAIGFRDRAGHVWAPAFAGVGCPSAAVIVARPGTTVLRFRARATYSQCTASPSSWPPTAPAWVPPCRSGAAGRAGQIPLLAPGPYTVVFVPAAAWHGPRVSAAALTITS